MTYKRHNSQIWTPLAEREISALVYADSELAINILPR